MNLRELPTEDDGTILRVEIHKELGVPIAYLPTGFFNKDVTPEVKAFVCEVEKLLASLVRGMKKCA